MKLIDKFNEKQKEIFEKANIELTDKEYTDDEIIELEDIISDYLQEFGIDENDEVNTIGLICESIMDIFAEI